MEDFYKALIGLGFRGSWEVLKKKFKKKPLSIDEIKKRIRILFIDDESFDYLIENIRNGGWNVKQIKDVDNFDSDDIKNSDIIFVDYKNVGNKLTPSEEGIGLLKAIRNKYPSKRLFFYSGYAGVIPGYEFHDIVDSWIPKNSDPYVYIARIEDAAKKIYGQK